MKREKLAEGEIFHLCNKSIANFGIFKDIDNGFRFLHILEYYNDLSVTLSFSDFLNINRKYLYKNLLIQKEKPYVKFLAYCIMPDHYHLLVKIFSAKITNYVSKIENSFSRYFNLKFERKGPLWQSRFRSVRIKTNEQLLHVHRYIHLNPTTAGLVDKPEKWLLSSYRDFIEETEFLKKEIREISIFTPKLYKKFVEDQKEYQIKLKQIKSLLLE